jgi:histone acetyltransferase (RNA polymerase elongator complex component)
MIVPFFIPHAGCPHQCVFCNQKNITGQSRPPDVSSIKEIITAYLNTNSACTPVEIAFYGGSFTALAGEEQQSYLDAVQPFIHSGAVQSIRLSTRPDCVSRETLTVLRERSVGTIELGAQSMDETVLALSERGHTAMDTVRATSLVKEQGFRIGLQLMPGLPGDSARVFMNSVDTVIKLKPDFVRLYPLLVIKGTPLEKLYKTGHYTPLSLHEAVAQCREAMLRFARHGIEVVRVGLQPTDELRKPGTIVAGPYHPAFRQLVESSILLDRMRASLSESQGNNGVATFLVNPRDISAAIGQKRFNVVILKEEFKLKNVGILPDLTVQRMMVKRWDRKTPGGNSQYRHSRPC